MTHPDAHLLTLVDLLEGRLSAAEGASVRERLVTDTALLAHWKLLAGSIEQSTPPDDIDRLAEFDFETVAEFVDGRLAPSDALEFERRCWENPAALREVVSLVRSTIAEPQVSYAPAGFGRQLADIAARECETTPTNGSPEAPVQLAGAGKINGHAGPPTAGQHETDHATRQTAFSRSRRSLLWIAATLLLGAVVGVATYVAVYNPSSSTTKPLADDRDLTPSQNPAPAPRHELPPKKTGGDRRPVKVVKTPSGAPGNSAPAVARMPKTSGSDPENQKPDPPVAARPFVPVAWSKVSGIVAWRKADTDRWGGVQGARTNEELTGPLTVRTLPAGWLHAQFQNGPDYVLAEGTEVRVSARRAAGSAPRGHHLRIIHRRGKAAVSRLKRGHRLRVAFAGGESAMNVQTDDTSVGFVESDKGMLEIVVWNGRVEFAGRVLNAGQAVRWSGKRVGEPTAATAAHRWRRRPARRPNMRKSIVDRLNRSNDLLRALVGEPKRIPARDVADAARLGFWLDPVETVPTAVASPIEAHRTSAVEWLLAADDRQPPTQLVWRRITRSVGPAVSRLSLRRWFHAAKTNRPPDAQLLRSLSSGLAANQPVFVRQSAIYFFRHFTRLPLREYHAERPTSTAIDSVRRKARRVFASQRRRKRN